MIRTSRRWLTRCRHDVARDIDADVGAPDCTIGDVKMSWEKR
jgi:hypothetical protein